MPKFELYDRRKYRRISLKDDDGVYCIVSNTGSVNKTVTVPAGEFSEKGFMFSISLKMEVDFFSEEKLILKAIVGTRNLTFAEPIAFEIKWQNLDTKKNRTFVGCKIYKVATESEKKFVAFVMEELKFEGK